MALIEVEHLTKTYGSHVVLDDTSVWILTADTSITSFEGNVSGIVSNGYKPFSTYLHLFTSLIANTT